VFPTYEQKDISLLVRTVPARINSVRYNILSYVQNAYRDYLASRYGYCSVIIFSIICNLSYTGILYYK